MISIVITTFNEPQTIGKAIESIVKQKIKESYELLVVCPDKPTIKVIESYAKKYPQVKHVMDDGKGKSYAINLLLKELIGRIIILTDGDVYVSENSINHIIEVFKDEKVGCVSGRPVSIEDKNTMLGYWSHLLCDSAHYLRLERNKKNDFLECSGYFWAFRNNIIESFPLDVAEDSVIPCMFWKKRYKIKYSPNSIVYVSYPKNFQDFIKQKKRTIKSHEKIHKYIEKRPKMKTFSSESLGIWYVLLYPSTIKEFFYTLIVIPVRAYLWFIAYKEYILKKEYNDAWERVESTK
ncbi:glycosyltransferase [Candidatus Pacearchaeota archaeon]|nr:glycosyltransferase [Candidatus Pacearchaeota archaeon]